MARLGKADARLLVLELLLESSQVLATTTPQIRFHLCLSMIINYNHPTFIFGNSICSHHIFAPKECVLPLSYKCNFVGRVFATTTSSDVWRSLGLKGDSMPGRPRTAVRPGNTRLFQRFELELKRSNYFYLGDLLKLYYRTVRISDWKDWMRDNRWEQKHLLKEISQKPIKM